MTFLEVSAKYDCTIKTMNYWMGDGVYITFDFPVFNGPRFQFSQIINNCTVREHSAEKIEDLVCRSAIESFESRNKGLTGTSAYTAYYDDFDTGERMIVKSEKR